MAEITINFNFTLSDYFYLVVNTMTGSRQLRNVFHLVVTNVNVHEYFSKILYKKLPFPTAMPYTKLVPNVNVYKYFSKTLYKSCHSLLLCLIHNWSFVYGSQMFSLMAFYERAQSPTSAICDPSNTCAKFY